MPRPLVPERRRRILDAARELILTEGWPGTTIAQIASRAGIGKGAVYLEFVDKPAILDAVLRRSMRESTAAVHARVVEAPGLVDLPAIYRFGVEALLDDPLMLALYAGDERVLGAHVQDVADDRYPTRTAWLADYVGELQRAGVIDPAIEADVIVRVLSVFTVGLIHSPGVLGVVTPERLRESVELFAGVVGRGLAPGRPADPAAARAAQLALIERLSGQLDAMEER